MQQLITSTFEGAALSTFKVDGRPVWIAREVGAALGYAQRGKRFATRITGEWASELIEGHDFAVLTGSDLPEESEGTDPVPLSGNRGLVVLFESGMHLALVKSTKPAGVRLRRFLADEVMPALARTGAHGQGGASGRLSGKDLRAALDQMNATAEALLAQGLISKTEYGHRLIAATEFAAGTAMPDYHNALIEDSAGAVEVRSGEASKEAMQKVLSWAHGHSHLLWTLGETHRHHHVGRREEERLYLPTHVVRNLLGTSYGQVKTWKEKGWTETSSGRMTKKVRIGDRATWVIAIRLDRVTRDGLHFGPLPEDGGELIEALAEGRRQLGLTQAEFANRLGIAARGRPYATKTVAHWEQGLQKPSLNALTCWADIVGLSLKVE